MAFYEKITDILPISDLERAESFYSAFQTEAEKDDALRDKFVRFNRSEPAVKFLKAIFCASPYLTGLIMRDLQSFFHMLEEEPVDYIEHSMSMVSAQMEAAGSDDEAMLCLRQYKNRIALAIGLYDAAGLWHVEEVTHNLTLTADLAVHETVRYLLTKAVKKGDYLPVIAEKPEIGSGLIVLGMGKYGAYELNYSSDIDLIIFFDPNRTPLKEGVEISRFFVRLTKDLSRLLQERTGAGYVYRVDLRLRPDPGATQPALSQDAALVYYENFAQNWERAAYIKARPVAGDFVAGELFLKELSPFIWRKYLDFSAIADVHAMKRQIHQYKGHGKIAVAGHNIKLGRGGIREIEFFAQTQQIIAGGRQPDLRSRRTCTALEKLFERQWISQDAQTDLTAAYYFLRDVEHRLQMVNDEQTHTMPEDEERLRSLAYFSGFQDFESFEAELLKHMYNVQQHYSALFEDVDALTVGESNLVFTGDDDDPETVKNLADMGFSDPAGVIKIVKSWHVGRYPAMRSEKARERLTEFQPFLIEALSKTTQPDFALTMFDRFLSDLPAGVQLFSMLRNNTELLRLVADIVGTAPRLAHILSRRARLLDAVVDPGFFGQLPTEDILQDIVQERVRAQSYEECLDNARLVGKEQSFLTGVRVLSGTITAHQAGHAYARLAEILISELFDIVRREMELAHGAIEGECAVLAMGKLGSREMTASSDLDLIVIYDGDSASIKSDGAKPLSGTQYYSRFTQRLISALSAPTAQGRLYEVDMRLRPSGNAGPVATHIESFTEYQKNQAWTWEHLALTRARVICGAPALCERIAETIHSVLAKPRDIEKTAQDILEMRARIAAQKKPKTHWNIKYSQGGLLDLEFIAQYLQLIHSAAHPEILNQNTIMALDNIAHLGLLSPADSTILIPAARLYHNLTQILRLCLEHEAELEDISPGLQALLLRVSGEQSWQNLNERVQINLEQVDLIFRRIIQS